MDALESWLDRVDGGGYVQDSHKKAAAPAPDDTLAILSEDLDRFKHMQARAARAGYVLRNVQSGGYMALKGCASFHSNSLDAIHAYLANRGAAK